MSRPRIAGLLETALYVDDMARSVRFFRDVLGLVPMIESERLTAFDAGHGGVLLVFARGLSIDDVAVPGGTIPGHDGDGPLHMAFAIGADDCDRWRAHFAAHDVAVTHEVTWPAGGRSLYFNDPDGHVLELATPGLWKNDADRPAGGQGVP
ncbi:VOC family protein [Sphingomonas jeddahensis]|uniref:Fosfomycin resistance protein FosB n=1 Tax=Sphingomonas jeddahensis TaxID=1915074 RepID=A0A1V2EVV2_9SPHN|nr:VOC family protein [Sphingomonas jeddahensis]ONF96615.1 fosfomycin resistance protein FosB [Sphingomonas jeddahensis]